MSRQLDRTLTPPPCSPGCLHTRQHLVHGFRLPTPRAAPPATTHGRCHLNCDYITLLPLTGTAAAAYPNIKEARAWLFYMPTYSPSCLHARQHLVHGFCLPADQPCHQLRLTLSNQKDAHHARQQRPHSRCSLHKQCREKQKGRSEKQSMQLCTGGVHHSRQQQPHSGTSCPPPNTNSQP